MLSYYMKKNIFNIVPYTLKIIPATRPLQAAISYLNYNNDVIVI